MAQEQTPAVSPEERRQLLYTSLRDEIISNSAYPLVNNPWKHMKITKDDGQYFAADNGKRFIAFNCDPQIGITTLSIREDCNTRTVFNGFIEKVEDLMRIWYLTDTHPKYK